MQQLTLTELLDLFENAIKNATEEELKRLRDFQLSISIPQTLHSQKK